MEINDPQEKTGPPNGNGGTTSLLVIRLGQREIKLMGRRDQDSVEKESSLLEHTEYCRRKGRRR